MLEDCSVGGVSGGMSCLSVCSCLCLAVCVCVCPVCAGVLCVRVSCVCVRDGQESVSEASCRRCISKSERREDAVQCGVGAAWEAVRDYSPTERLCRRRRRPGF